MFLHVMVWGHPLCRVKFASQQVGDFLFFCLFVFKSVNSNFKLFQEGPQRKALVESWIKVYSTVFGGVIFQNGQTAI